MTSVITAFFFVSTGHLGDAMHEYSIGSDTGVHDVFSSTISIEASEHPGLDALMGGTG